MSAGLVPYSVPLDAVRAFFGGKDVPLCTKLETLYRREVADNAALHRQAIADGAPTLDVALRHLCAGETTARRFGAQYVYALELLCAYFGTKLRNQAVYPIDDEWLLRMVDPVFDGWGVGDFVKLKALIYGHWPFKIPHAEFPRGGSLELEPIERALAVMRRGALPRFDHSIVGVIGDVRGWLEVASQQQRGLVCFYY